MSIAGAAGAGGSKSVSYVLDEATQKLIPLDENQCGVCFKVLSSRGALRIHYRVHTGERPFACPECSMAFAKNGDLTRHMRSHTDERPFQCPTCGKHFRQTSHLKEHAKRHER